MFTDGLFDGFERREHGVEAGHAEDLLDRRLEPTERHLAALLLHALVGLDDLADAWGPRTHYLWVRRDEERAIRRLEIRGAV